MGQTITEKIFSDHAGKAVKAGDIVRVKVDMTIGNDITTPLSIRAFEESGATKLANPNGFCIVMDHFIPAKDIASANQARISRDFAAKHNMKLFFDEKDMGIEHALLPEKGLVVPGDVIIGADSHTCTHGALGAFSTGMGSTDLAFTMITGENWFKVPETIKVVFKGKPKEFVTGKDLILEIIRMIGVDGALYKALEFTGDTIQYLTMDDRFSLCNMAIEAGAKNGIVAVDDTTRAFLADKNLARTPKEFYSDEDAEYCQVLEIDVAALEPVIAYPFLPSNGKPLSQAVADKIKIDQAFIGSCTNGRLSDLEMAAKILKGKKVADYVKLIVTPASRKIYLQASKMGILDTLAEAGAMITHPGCGLCCGRAGGILSDGERVVATNNRNFLGRMGTSKVEIYLASPKTAAACAVAGKIVTPEV